MLDWRCCFADDEYDDAHKVNEENEGDDVAWIHRISVENSRIRACSYT